MSKSSPKWLFDDYDEYGWSFKCSECGEVIYAALRRDAPKHCPKCYERLAPYESEVN